MYLKNDRIIVTIKYLTMRSFKTKATGQFILDPTAILGWTDGTAARRDNTTRAASSGDFYEPAKMSSRIISLSGAAIAANRQELQELRDMFTGLLADGLYTTVSVETSAGTRYTLAGLEGTPSWVQKLDNVAMWKLDLYAPDPYIYGETKSVMTGAYVTEGGLKYKLKYPLNYNVLGENTIQTVTNRGNATSWPVFKVTGDYYTGFSIDDNKGSTVSYNGTVLMGSPVYIDMAKGTATQDGVDRTTLLTNRDWVKIPAYETIQPRFKPHQYGTGWCDIIYRDTWI